MRAERERERENTLVVVAMLVALLFAALLTIRWMAPGRNPGLGWSEIVTVAVGVLAALALWAAVVVAIALGVSWWAARADRRRETVLDLLDRRFTAGELSAEHYREMRRLLLGH